MRKYFNFMFYFIYRLDYKFHQLFAKINPVITLHKFLKKDKDHDKYLNELNNTFEDPEDGLSSMFAGGILIGLYYTFCFSIILIVTSNKYGFFDMTKIHALILSIPIIGVIYYLVFKDDVYLEYFTKFKNVGRKRRRIIYILLSLNILVIILFFFYSLLYTGYKSK